MSLSSELRSWARHEWRSVRGWLALACVLSAILAVTSLDVRVATISLMLATGYWALWTLVRLVALVVFGVPIFAVGMAVRPYIRAQQAKKDIDREMRKLPFEQR